MLRNSLVGPAVVGVLLLTGLAGCIVNQDEAATAGLEPDAIPVLGPGDAQRLEGMSIQVGHPVPLPDRYASEPSIAVADDGTIAVAAPAGSSFSPTLHLHGGYVWISTDGGKSFELKLDPRPPAEAPTAAACSCDTDVTAIGNEIFATTMYFTVNPFFNANIVSSKDKGQNWELRNPMAADKQPIDRHWISPGPDNDLLLAYVWTVGREYLLGEERTIFLQKSTDGGESWGDSIEVVRVEDRENESYFVMKPKSIPPSTIILPITHYNFSNPDSPVELQVAVSHDSGDSFTVNNLEGWHRSLADFHFSVDASASGQVVAAWARADDTTGTETVYIRTSADSGDTWGPTQAAPLPGSAVQPWVALREDGAIAIAYYGSNETDPIPEMDDETPWSPQVVIYKTFNVSEDPVAILDLSGDATFYGRPCNGAVCAEGDSGRSIMREFLSAEWSSNNMLHVAYINAQDTSDESRVPTETLLRGRVVVSTIDAISN